MEKAEVPNQQMIDESPETGWRQCDTPGRSEAAASDQLCDEVAASSKIATAPAPNSALISAGRPAGA